MRTSPHPTGALVRGLALVAAVSCLVPQTGCAFARLNDVLVADQPARQGDRLPVQIEREQSEIEATLGMSLKKGDVIESGADVTAFIEFRGGTEIMMYPNTRIELLNPSIKQLFGGVWASVKGLFTVEDENEQYFVDGTEFVLQVGEDQHATLTVLEGSVRVSPHGQRWAPRLIRAGQRAYFPVDADPQMENLSSDQMDEIISGLNQRARARRKPGKVLVPNVRRRSEAAARDRLARAGLNVAKVKTTFDGDVPFHTVQRQDPPPLTRAPVGKSVHLTLRVESVTVPSVENLPQIQARRQLLDAGLTIGRIRTKFTGRHDPKTVIATEPRAGKRVRKGESVEIVVEADWIPMPDLNGWSEDRARDELARLGLRVEAKRADPRYREGIAGPTVVRQRPDPGDPLELNKRVRLYVARPGVRVPPVEGLFEQQARAALAEAGLRVGRVSRKTSSRRRGSVVEQDPPARRVVAPRSSVDLTISTGKVVVERPRPHVSEIPARGDPSAPQCTVPEVRTDFNPAQGSGEFAHPYSLFEALRDLDAAKLQKITIIESGRRFGRNQYVRREYSYKVTRQTPQGRSRVPCDREIQLTVERFPTREP